MVQLSVPIFVLVCVHHPILFYTCLRDMVLLVSKVL